MSCDRNSAAAATAASGSGVPKILSKAAYLSGLRGGMRRIQARLKTFRRAAAEGRATAAEGRQNTPVDYDSLDSLDRQTIQPVEPKSGQNCQKCGTGSGKPGPWYVIGKQPHCGDCATGAAKEAGVKLARPVEEQSPATAPGFTFSTSARKTPSVGRMPLRDPEWTKTVRLKESQMSVTVDDPSTGETRQVPAGKAYAVLSKTGGRHTGLAVTSYGLGVHGNEVKVESWIVTHTKTGDAIGDEYGSLDDAVNLTARLVGARINWLRPFEAMPKNDLNAAIEIVARHKAELKKG